MRNELLLTSWTIVYLNLVALSYFLESTILDLVYDLYRIDPENLFQFVSRIVTRVHWNFSAVNFDINFHNILLND